MRAQRAKNKEKERDGDREREGGDVCEDGECVKCRDICGTHNDSIDTTVPQCMKWAICLTFQRITNILSIAHACIRRSRCVCAFWPGDCAIVISIFVFFFVPNFAAVIVFSISFWFSSQSWFKCPCERNLLIDWINENEKKKNVTEYLL